MRSPVAHLFLLAVLSTTPTHAADPAKQPAMTSRFDLSVDCSNLEKLNNMELNQCTGRALEVADRDLNGVYGELAGTMDAADRKLLVAAERAWIAWRDSECEFEAQGVSGYDRTGSGYGLEVGRCRLGLTKARVEQLRAYLRDVRQLGR
jgi:uncharacterized protein YecT (DUF1311 family)